MPQTEQAQSFSERAIVAMRRRKPRLTVTALAAGIRKARPTVSRALNKNEFPEVRRKIARFLGIQQP